MGFIRKLFPRTAMADKSAFVICHFGLMGMFLFQLLLVLPKYHQPLSFMFNLHVSTGFFLAYQVFSNMYSMILVDSTVKRKDLQLPCVLQAGWIYCHICQVNAPPRSHHCPVCKVCVLKRDHHCIFTGNCVGFHNHRYFMVFALYLWLGCVYTIIFTKDFYTEMLGQYDLVLFFKFLFPMLVWSTGYIDSYQLGVLIVMAINIMAMFLFTLLLGFQVFFISRGQTQFECRKKVRKHNLNFVDNWKLVLGKSWYLVWLSCYVSSQLPGDGLEYPTKCEDHLKI